MTSTTSTSEALVLKTDRRGRVQVPSEQREAILDEFESSSMSGAQFARHYGIKYQTFAWWRTCRRRERQKQAPPEAAVSFAELTALPAQEPGDCVGQSLGVDAIDSNRYSVWNA